MASHAQDLVHLSASSVAGRIETLFPGLGYGQACLANHVSGAVVASWGPRLAEHLISIGVSPLHVALIRQELVGQDWLAAFYEASCPPPPQPARAHVPPPHVTPPTMDTGMLTPLERGCNSLMSDPSHLFPTRLSDVLSMEDPPSLSNPFRGLVGALPTYPAQPVPPPVKLEPLDPHQPIWVPTAHPHAHAHSSLAAILAQAASMPCAGLPDLNFTTPPRLHAPSSPETPEPPSMFASLPTVEVENERQRSSSAPEATSEDATVVDTTQARSVRPAPAAPRRRRGAAASRYLGVHKRGPKFQARLRNSGANQKSVLYGTFATELEAAKMYDLACWHAHRDRTLLNFPDRASHYSKQDPPVPKTRKKPDKRSRFRGVSWKTSHGKWRVSFYVPRLRRMVTLGYHADEEYAARVHDVGARHYFGDQANLNFPDDPPLPVAFENLTRKRAPRQKKLSRYRGVSYERRRKSPWKAQVPLPGGNRTVEEVGMFETEEEAARAYDTRCWELHRNTHLLNFPLNVSTSTSTYLRE